MNLEEGQAILKRRELLQELFLGELLFGEAAFGIVLNVSRISHVHAPFDRGPAVHLHDGTAVIIYSMTGKRFATVTHFDLCPCVELRRVRPRKQQSLSRQGSRVYGRSTGRYDQNTRFC